MVRLVAAMCAPCQLQNFIIWEAPFLLLEGPLSKNPCILFEKSGWKGEREEEAGGRRARRDTLLTYFFHLL